MSPEKHWLASTHITWNLILHRVYTFCFSLGITFCFFFFFSSLKISVCFCDLMPSERNPEHLAFYYTASSLCISLCLWEHMKSVFAPWTHFASWGSITAWRIFRQSSSWRLEKPLWQVQDLAAGMGFGGAIGCGWLCRGSSWCKWCILENLVTLTGIDPLDMTL